MCQSGTCDPPVSGFQILALYMHVPRPAPQDLDMTGLKEGHVYMFLNKKAKVLSESAGEL